MSDASFFIIRLYCRLLNPSLGGIFRVRCLKCCLLVGPSVVTVVVITSVVLFVSVSTVAVGLVESVIGFVCSDVLSFCTGVVVFIVVVVVVVIFVVAVDTVTVVLIIAVGLTVTAFADVTSSVTDSVK